MNTCQHCGQSSLVSDKNGPVCPDCIEEGYYEERKPDEKQKDRKRKC